MYMGYVWVMYGSTVGHIGHIRVSHGSGIAEPWVIHGSCRPTIGHAWVIHRSRMDHVGHTGQPLVVFGLAMGPLGHMCQLGHTKTDPGCSGR